MMIFPKAIEWIYFQPEAYMTTQYETTPEAASTPAPETTAHSTYETPKVEYSTEAITEASSYAAPTEASSYAAPTEAPTTKAAYWAVFST